MTAMILRRVGGLVLTLLAAALVVFVVMEVLPGDPAAVMLGTEAREDTLAALRRQYGFDRPMAERFAKWIIGLAQFDFGESYTYGVPVATLIGERLSVTAPLAIMAICFAVAIAIPLGVFAAANHNRPGDAGVMVFSQLGVALPNFWIGMLMVLVFAITLGWLPGNGFPGWDRGVGRAFLHLLMPAVALALPQAAILARVCRSAVLDTLGEDYVRTARAKGLPWTTVLRRHVLRNAMIPVATIMGLQFSALLAGAIIIENVFALPGLGRLVFQAIAQRDLIVVKDVVVFLAGLVVVINFVVDVAYLILDPRLRRIRR
jgi:peptide/nickel transport system permease protein